MRLGRTKLRGLFALVCSHKMDAITTDNAWMRPAKGGACIARTDISTHEKLLEVIQQHRDLSRYETNTGLYDYDAVTGEINVLNIGSHSHRCDIANTKNECAMKGKAMSARRRALIELERRRAMKK